MKTLLPVVFIFLLHATASAQSVPSKKKWSTDEIHAQLQQFAKAFPDLYRQDQFDSIRAITEQRLRYGGPGPDILAIKTLLAIEANTFQPDSIPIKELFDLLDDYTDMIAAPDDRSKSYYSTRHFDGAPYTKVILSITASWARRLLQSRSLDSTETFLCRIFTGEIAHPTAAIRTGKQTYPILDSLLIRSQHLYRNSPTGDLALLMSSWIPNRNLSQLGIHPGLGILFGYRNKYNEWNIALTFRFIHTPTPYMVLRGDSLYKRDYYQGTYGGLEYTRFLVHTLHFEAGPRIGFGYDGFLIAAQSKYNPGPAYLKPLGIGSLDYNAGARFNYFFNPHFHLGLDASYHYIHYHNDGGTPLDGNALVLEFMIGLN